MKTWDQRRNLQVIQMRRDNARACINSLRYFRSKNNHMFNVDIKGIEAEVNAAIQNYRQTNKVLHKNI